VLDAIYGFLRLRDGRALFVGRQSSTGKASGTHTGTGRASAAKAIGFDVESSAENPKNDERTKGEPGGKKLRTCSEV
jgi:hypothetical protein